MRVCRGRFGAQPVRVGGSPRVDDYVMMLRDVGLHAFCGMCGVFVCSSNMLLMHERAWT
jgi:hypothetical protein